MLTGQNFQPQVFVHLTGKRHGTVRATAERAVEARIVCIGAQVQPGEVPEGEAVHFVQRRGRIAGAAAAAQVGGHPDLFRDLDARPGAETLKQEFIQQPGTDQGGIKGWNIAKIIVVEIELDARVWLHANGEEAAPQAAPGDGVAALP